MSIVGLISHEVMSRVVGKAGLPGLSWRYEDYGAIVVVVLDDQQLIRFTEEHVEDSSDEKLLGQIYEAASLVGGASRLESSLWLLKKLNHHRRHGPPALARIFDRTLHGLDVLHGFSRRHSVHFGRRVPTFGERIR